MENDVIISSVNQRVSMFDGVSPKLTFIMGIVSGVAIVSLTGFVLAASYSLSGQSIGSRSATGVIAQTPPSPSPTSLDNEPSAPPAKVNVTIKNDDYIRGSKNAQVTLVEYSDAECPFSKRFHPNMQKLLQEFPGKVRWVYRHFPLSFHANAQKKAEASECAGKLGGNDKFWTYTDKMLERTAADGTGLALADLVPLAKELGLNESKFKTCLDSGEFTARVQTDIAEGTAFGVKGTPTTFVNGETVRGAVPYDQLKQVVESLLK